MRADSKSATATVAPAASAAAGQEHEQLQQYGVFKLSYNTANVSGHWGALVVPLQLSPCLNSQLLATFLLYLQEDPSLTKAWQKTVRVAVTGASGQIANHLLFMVSQLCSMP